MAPASAGVAFVGFAGSIAALAVVTLDCCKTVHNVVRAVGHAPKNVERLVKLVKRLESFLGQLGHVNERLLNSNIEAGIEDYWIQHAAEMELDLSQFRLKVSELNEEFTKRSHSSKNTSARLKTFFSEDETSQYERRLRDHIGTATSMLTMVNT